MFEGHVYYVRAGSSPAPGTTDFLMSYGLDFMAHFCFAESIVVWYYVHRIVLRLDFINMFLCYLKFAAIDANIDLKLRHQNGVGLPSLSLEKKGLPTHSYT